MVSDPETVIATVNRYETAQAELAALSFDALSVPQALTLKDRLETIAGRQAAIDHRLTHPALARATPARHAFQIH